MTTTWLVPPGVVASAIGKGATPSSRPLLRRSGQIRALLPRIRPSTLLLRSVAPASERKQARDHPFLERLRRGPLLGDGAMGTHLHARGVSFERSFDELNLTEPRIVEEIHRAYISAGAELIETNTFGV